MKEKIYSIKMRASKEEKHISGAERIVLEKEIDIWVKQLTYRAFNHSKGSPDSIHINIQNITDESVEYIAPLDIKTILADDYLIGRKCAVWALQKAGLSDQSAYTVLNILEECSNMRGAILLDIHSLQRLEPNKDRGIRVTNMDWDFKIKKELDVVLEEKGLNNNHVKEAVALASKVNSAPGIIAELCWSDDPDYTAGYVASKEIGYMRITNLKPLGSHAGGRVFCFDSSKVSVEECIDYLQKRIGLINKIPKIKKSISYKDIMEEQNEIYK